MIPENYKDDPLWKRIEAYELDDPHADIPFSRKLSHEHDWGFSFTERVIIEYKRFVYLCVKSPTGASPSWFVDQAWHLHLTYTKEYWDKFCEEVLQKKLHHHPSAGGTGEDHRHEDWYKETLDQYRKTFGSAPPADIWPAPAPVVANVSIPDLEPHKPNLVLPVLLLLLPFALSWILWQKPDPFTLKGPQFLVFFPVLVGCAIAGFLALYFIQKQAISKTMQAFGNLPGEDLAFISGGGSRMEVFLISDLLQNKVLEEPSGFMYKVNRDELGKSTNPLAETIRRKPEEWIQHNDLKPEIKQIETKLSERYNPLLARFGNRWLYYAFPLAVGIIGITRMVQGIMNHRPVTILVFLLVISAFVFIVLVSQCTLYRQCASVVKKDSQLTSHLTSFNRNVVVDGFTALATLPLFIPLTYLYGASQGPTGSSNNIFSNNTSHSSSGDSGSSSSSCGGCGGSSD